MTTAGDPTLLLVHGLGANARVWDPVLARLDGTARHARRVVVPDLAGHGRAAWTGDYTVGALAAQVAGQLEVGEPVVAIGHSLGGGVCAALASGWFRPNVLAVAAIGVKVSWSADDVAMVAGVAAKGIRWSSSRDEAAQRFMRQAGLAGLVEGDDPVVDAGITSEEQGWRPSQDPATFAQNALDMASLVAAARCPIVLGAGAGDAMVSGEELSRFATEVRLRPGVGHNAHVEDPAWICELATELSSRFGPDR